MMCKLKSGILSLSNLFHAGKLILLHWHPPGVGFSCSMAPERISVHSYSALSLHYSDHPIFFQSQTLASVVILNSVVRYGIRLNFNVHSRANYSKIKLQLGLGGRLNLFSMLFFPSF